MLGRWWRYKWITFHPSLTLIFREQLCELNIHRGNTVVQVTLA
ncbi:TPA: Hok/Gef family protein [Escherichia coli]|nr:Hok/Gef family protein [Escherichia coli]